ncbi:Cytochrome C biogenesis protein transmembrane region [Roseisalinus antarcticus]|uniref:Cytochrome C biogenesis protein transmembrane region n=2 Tax=Roseisalinus antarcticus TaxID=254357 RepID=A0A1Y5TYK3_9RHOB|nr:Cytochrome C biogenesis protein transmembrane region [Roseisalinus antarcticus]
MLGYVAGLLTLINPCVLPVLPIVLASALQVSRWGPVALALGMSVSFVLVGLSVAVFGRALGIDDLMVAKAGGALMVGFGLVLLVPRFAHGFELATAGLSARADQGMDEVDRSGLRGQAVGGAILGAVWVPCVGPTLGGAIAMASAGEDLGWAAAIMVSFAAGISTIILALGYGAQAAIRARRDWLRAVAARARPTMGVIFVAVGAAILFDLQKFAEIWLLDTLPYWLQDLSVRY